MKTINFKILAYLAFALFAGFLTFSCGNCDDGNNFEDQQSTQVIDSLSVAH
ncbi:hypothetical protein J2X31_003336 [Flavobacterium arsenatis]|uniref:Secreted protein n=1 Tax=Flavobacterium arsenatis TaxID=1484332 RepID=A0ABU1TTZ2_9FLAO|nr:hypothetical protein [Flavobacterium arsenatis]MDR6969306.1 hypothetical protein [Flavobacterium arsenatis]